MQPVPLHAVFLAQETRSLVTRLGQVRAFALQMPSVPAATISPAALAAIERHTVRARQVLSSQAGEYISWLQSSDGRRATAGECQRRFTILKLRFNSLLDDYDIFADVISQRSEHEAGVWVAGLDLVAAEALAMPRFFKAPPVVCYLDRGHGAAIRRARTRLPGGEENPVAVIRVPRERMVGSGIASSLVHEVGHQGASLLGLVESLRPVLREKAARNPRQAAAWKLYERWISEIVADFWSVARIGIGSTLGLMGVVSLPRFFVLRTALDDPHPTPWIRVRLSCVMGQALFPHVQWQRLSQLWATLYPLQGLAPEMQRLFARLEAAMPEFVTVLVNHKPASLRGRTLREAMEVSARQPATLREHWRVWQRNRAAMRSSPPSLVFGVIGQARADRLVSPEEESRILSDLLATWALRSTLRTADVCNASPQSTTTVPAPIAGVIAGIPIQQARPALAAVGG